MQIAGLVKPALFLSLSTLVGACTAEVATLPEDDGATAGASISFDQKLSGCHGTATTAIPGDGKYVLTSFGGGGDTQPMSCGGTADGTGWYAASRQRYGCGGRVKIEANGKCAVVATKDYGPDACVERAAGAPIIDASPAVSRLLFGTSSAGWSDRFHVTVTEVPATTPLGICATDPAPDPTPDPGMSTGTGCNSATLDRDVDEGVCVKSSTDAAMYQCEAGAWVAKTGTAGCVETYGYCASATLGTSVPARTCVQSASSGSWFQCNGQGWVTPVDTAAKSGPLGNCSTWHAL